MKRFVLAAAALFCTVSPSYGFAQVTSNRVLITAPIDDTQRVTLAGNTRPEANAANDRGAVPADLPLHGMLLQLKRSPADEAVVDRFIAQLHDPASPLFHRWLTAEEFGRRFGLAQSDIDRITGWLSRYGFTVERVYPGRMAIEFSGTAGKVAAAFHTEIHRLDVNGVAHIANMSDPQIPAALGAAVAGITSLHDFRPQSRLRPAPRYTGNGFNLVAPGDLATIYNINKVFAKNITGAGVTVAVVEDTDLYDNNKDWYSFRTTFALTKYKSGQLTVVHPDCTDPGAAGPNAGDEIEAAIDAEWASAAAPGAEILFASCNGTETTDGVTQAIENLVNAANPPPIISISYGVCETENGQAGNRTYYNAYSQAVTEGVSVFVATGDNGATDCAPNGQEGATLGIGVDGWASTIYNVAAGGTDFADVYLGDSSTYWKANSGAPWSTAKSYIPETPWNDTCAGTLLAGYSGFSLTYGASGFCNSAAGSLYTMLGGGEGGPSGCATGAPSVPGVVSGTCEGYPKPSWQKTVYGNPADGVRDLPDVSMFASNGTAWGHFLIACFSDPDQGGTPCTGDPFNWAGDAGGTSFAAPIVAGIQALVNQHLGLTTKGVGNPNTVYYKLAASEYSTAAGRSACNSTKGNAIGANCVFNDVTLGDDDIDCTVDHGKLYNCYRPSGAFGVLSTSNTAYKPAFKAGAGYNYPTGLGSINAYNLMVNWP